MTANPALVARQPIQPIDTRLPGSRLLAQDVVSKFTDYLPLGRQQGYWPNRGRPLLIHLGGRAAAGDRHAVVLFRTRGEWGQAPAIGPCSELQLVPHPRPE